MKPVVLVLLFVLFVGIANAQVYIGPLGSEWNGVCDNACPQSAPCNLSASAETTLTGPCVLMFEGGMEIPGHTFHMSVGGNITLSSSGGVTLAAGLTVESPGGGVVLQNFSWYGVNGLLNLNTKDVFMLNSSVFFWDGSQISMTGSSSVVIQNCSIRSFLPPMKWALAPGATVSMSHVTVKTTSALVDIEGSSEPSVYISDSTITVFIFRGSKLKDVTLERVVGTLDVMGSIWIYAPSGTTTIVNSSLISTSDSAMTGGLGTGSELIITGSQFENVVVKVPVTNMRLEKSTFTVRTLYDSVVYGSRLDTAILKNITIKSINGGNAVMSFFSGANSFIQLDMSDVVYSSPSDATRMKFDRNVRVLSHAIFPSLLLVGSTTFDGPFNHEFTDTISTTLMGTLVTMATNSLVTFHSITVGNSVSIGFQTGFTPEFAYRVTDPISGIKCSNPDKCFHEPGAIRIIWDSSLPLPTAGEPYPFVTSSDTSTTFFAHSSEYTISSSYDNFISYFTFEEVECPSFCFATYSNHCVSTAQCTCTEGHVGNCEFLPPVEVPLVEVPIEIVPSFTPYASENPTSLTPSSSESPVFDSPSATPSVSPLVSPSVSQSPNTVPTTVPSTGTPVNTSPDSPTSSAPRQTAGWVISLALFSILLCWF